MFAQTIPVNVIYDELFDCDEFPADVLGDRFVVLEIEGNYLVIHESIYEAKPSQQKFKCFTTKGDALAYLELWGIDIEEDEK